MTEFADTTLHMLNQAMAKPDDTIIVATMDAQGGMTMTVRSIRTIDLVQVARSLLEQAKDRTQEELDAEDCNSQGDDPVEERLSFLMAAIDELSLIDGMDQDD
jgi:hypothetical protein